MNRSLEIQSMGTDHDRKPYFKPRRTDTKIAMLRAAEAPDGYVFFTNLKRSINHSNLEPWEERVQEQLDKLRESNEVHLGTAIENGGRAVLHMQGVYIKPKTELKELR